MDLEARRKKESMKTRRRREFELVLLGFVLAGTTAAQAISCLHELPAYQWSVGNTSGPMLALAVVVMTIVLVLLGVIAPGDREVRISEAGLVALALVEWMLNLMVTAVDQQVFWVSRVAFILGRPELAVQRLVTVVISGILPIAIFLAAFGACRVARSWATSS
jgi:hypothetical protein